LRDLLGVPADAKPLTVRGALCGWTRSLCSDCLDDVYPYLGRMLSLPLEERAQASLRGLQAEGLRENTFRAAETLIVRTAGPAPLILVCEDLHWADPTSLTLLERILALPDRIPLLLVCVLRPETGHGCWQIRETAAREYRHRHLDLWLAPLSRDEGAALVGNLLRVEDLPSALRERILAYGEGNPFYVEEILRSLIDRQAIAYDEGPGRWRATQAAIEITIPSSLHGVLADRIDRLPDEAKRVLQIAAVIGRIFGERVLAAVASPLPGGAGSQMKDLEAPLLVLQHAQLIRERGRLPEREYIFKHYLTHEVACARIYAERAVSIHRATDDLLGMVWACAILAHACVEERDYVGARECLAQISGGGRMWSSGDVSWAQGDVERAKWEYEEALRLARAASSEWPEILAMCGLAAVALVEGNLHQAQGYTAKLLNDLEKDPWPIVFLGFRPHLVCYRVLRASEDPRADEVLEQAYGMLQERAAQIEDEELRRSYLEDVAVNREIMAEYARRH